MEQQQQQHQMQQQQSQMLLQQQQQHQHQQQQQQQLNHNTLSPVTNRSCEKNHRGNGMLTAEFLSDDDNSENNMAYNQEQNRSMNQLAQLNSGLAFQQMQGHLQNQEQVMSVFLFSSFFHLQMFVRLHCASVDTLIITILYFRVCATTVPSPFCHHDISVTTECGHKSLL